MAAKKFVDHYEVLGVEPDASASEIKKAYHKKLREFHPDKRKTGLQGLGHEISQLCNEAWEILSDAQKREAYDKQWCRNKKSGQEKESAAVNSAERAERYRREGNALYKAAVEARDSGANPTLADQKFIAAKNTYSTGIALAPRDHKLLSNRALCHAALQDWRHCQEDATRVTQLDPSFMKGWFMLAKSFWKQGSFSRALQEAQRGLVALPGCDDLLKLQVEIRKDMSDIAQSAEGPPKAPAARGPASRNPSPCQSRNPTPTRRKSHSPAPQRAYAESPQHQPPPPAYAPQQRAYAESPHRQPPPPSFPRGNNDNQFFDSPPRGYADGDDIPHFFGRPPPVPHRHRKASREPAEPEGHFRDPFDRARKPSPASRPDSWRTPREQSRDSSPAPAQPRGPSPAPQGMPPSDWGDWVDRPPAPPAPARGRGSLAGAAAAFNVFK